MSQCYFDNPVTGTSCKNISFRFGVHKGGNLKDIVAVNWVKGKIKTEKGGYEEVMRLGQYEKVQYDTYRIDSLDPDPRWGSGKGSSGLAYMEKLGWAVWSDSPGRKPDHPLDPSQGRFICDLDFIMTLYNKHKVPLKHSQYGTILPLGKIHWKCKIDAVYNPTTRRFDIKHPGDEDVDVRVVTRNG